MVTLSQIQANLHESNTAMGVEERLARDERTILNAAERDLSYDELIETLVAKERLTEGEEPSPSALAYMLVCESKTRDEFMQGMAYLHRRIVEICLFNAVESNRTDLLPSD